MGNISRLRSRSRRPTTRAQTTPEQIVRDDGSHRVLGFLVFAGGRWRRYKKDMRDAEDKMRIAAIWSEWLLLGPEDQRVYMEVAVLPVASVKSAVVLAAHYRAREIFKECHSMAMYVPDVLQRLVIADPMPAAFPKPMSPEMDALWEEFVNGGN